MMRLPLAISGLGMLFVLVLVTGCGGGDGKSSDGAAPGGMSSTTVTWGTTTHHDMTTQSAPTKQELGEAYLRIVKPANEASDAFSKKARRWNDKTTNSQMSNDAAPMIAAWQKADSDLLRVNWSATARADVKALVRTDAAVIGDLSALGSLDPPSAGNWTRQFERDGAATVAAANIVRADIGLPPFQG